MSAIGDLYIDAVLTDETSHLVFMSIWGRDTALQEFIARLQLPLSDNGIRDFRVIGETTTKYVQVPNVDLLEKMTTKTSKNTVFGQLTQLWIYNKLVAVPDMVNRRAFMLCKSGHVPDPWPLIKTVCSLPLLDHWRGAFLDHCRKREWLRNIDGIGVHGVAIELGDDVGPAISEMIRSRELTLHPEMDAS